MRWVLLTICGGLVIAGVLALVGTSVRDRHRDLAKAIVERMRAA